MRLYYLILSTIVPLTILLSSLINLTYAQVNETSQTQTYENRDMGIRLSYPSEWGSITEGKRTNCSTDRSCAVSLESTSGSPIRMAIGKFSKEGCNCNSLTDFAKFVYEGAEKNRTNFSFINDNRTTVGEKYPSWQYESSFLNVDNVNTKSLDVLTANNETYFAFEISYPIELGTTILPTFRKVIDSIEFLPIQNQVTKAPSFMNMTETEESKPNATIENNPNGLQILSHNSFTDSVGYLHVVGEVQNNSPTNAQFVQVTGTFYDNNNQVVATDFTYTNPSDIGSGQKAPFDLTLISASIPVSQIDHYNLIASYQ